MYLFGIIYSRFLLELLFDIFASIIIWDHVAIAALTGPDSRPCVQGAHAQKLS